MRLIRHSKTLKLPDVGGKRLSRVYEDPVYSKVWDILKERGVWPPRAKSAAHQKLIDVRLLASLIPVLRGRDPNKAVRVYTQARAKHCEHVTQLLLRYIGFHRGWRFDEFRAFAQSVVHMLVARGLGRRHVGGKDSLFQVDSAAGLIQIRWRWFRRRRAAKKIQKQFRLWRWRKAVLWNPHTETGRNNLLLKAALAKLGPGDGY